MTTSAKSPQIALKLVLPPADTQISNTHKMADSRNDRDAHFFLPFPLALKIHLPLLQNFYSIAADTICVASAANAAPCVTPHISRCQIQQGADFFLPSAVLYIHARALPLE